MLIQVSPVLIALLAAIFLGERFTPYLGLGLALAFGGVALIALSTSAGGDRDVHRRRALPGLRGRLLDQPDPPEAAGGAAAARPRHLAGLHRSARSSCLPFAGQLWSRGAGGPGDLGLVAGLPRRLPDRDRVHHLRLRAQAHERVQPRRHDLPGAADHDRDGPGASSTRPRPRWRTSAARSPWSAWPWPGASRAARAATGADQAAASATDRRSRRSLSHRRVAGRTPASRGTRPGCGSTRRATSRHSHSLRIEEAKPSSRIVLNDSSA